jgi:hypothetical protein
MYAQSFFTTSDRGIGPFPTMTARSAEMFIGFINAEFDFAIFLINSYMPRSIPYPSRGKIAPV